MANKKALLTLVRDHSFETVEEYFDHIDMSISNGQLQQAIGLFKQMRPSDRRLFINYCWDSFRSYHMRTIFEIIGVYR